MVLLIVLLLIVLSAAVATVVELRRDGYRPTPTDWSRVAGRDPYDTAQVAHGHR